jgi:hypothetical protein
MIPKTQTGKKYQKIIFIGLTLIVILGLLKLFILGDPAKATKLEWTIFYSVVILIFIFTPLKKQTKK